MPPRYPLVVILKLLHVPINWVITGSLKQNTAKMHLRMTFATHLPLCLGRDELNICTFIAWQIESPI